MAVKALVNEHGVTAKEEHFAALLAIGHDATTAYFKAFKPRGTTRQAISERASKLHRKPLIEARAIAIQHEIDHNTLDSCTAVIVDLLAGIKQAMAVGNWTAWAAAMRLRMQAKSMLAENILIKHESTLSDDELIRRIAAQDTAMGDKLRDLLGNVSSFKRKAA